MSHVRQQSHQAEAKALCSGEGTCRTHRQTRSSHTGHGAVPLAAQSGLFVFSLPPAAAKRPVYSGSCLAEMSLTGADVGLKCLLRNTPTFLLIKCFDSTNLNVSEPIYSLRVYSLSTRQNPLSVPVLNFCIG